MMPWVNIRKRVGNAKLRGVDLGCESPQVKTKVHSEEENRLPKPKFDKTIVRKHK